MGSIGRSIAEGEASAVLYRRISPDQQPGSATFHYLLLVCSKIFGIYSLPSAVVLLVITVFFCVTCLPIYLIARRCFSEELLCELAGCGLISSVMAWATRWVWETSLRHFADFAFLAHAGDGR